MRANVDHASFMQANRDRWNELTPIHERSAFYDVASFRAGKTTLRPVEVEELGDVAGKSLLHLQCHFGLDTLSWARRGARVTGVDYSDQAVQRALALAREAGIEARFLCSNVYNLPEVLAERFDIVFTSYGVICWLPDLPRWARVAAHFLKPGGTFYLAEFHPFVMVFDDDPGVRDLRVRYPYFYSPEPLRWVSEGTYADRDAKVQHSASYVWNHTVGDVVNALVGAGLRIESLREFPYCPCAVLPFMEQGADEWWRIGDPKDTIPLMFSVKATKA